VPAAVERSGREQGNPGDRPSFLQRRVQGLRYRWHRHRSSHVLVSFPKSGRTWLRGMLERYLALTGAPPPAPLDAWFPWRRTGSDRRVPRLLFLHPLCRETDPAATWRLVDRLARKRLVLLVRHPEGTLRGYYFRLRLRERDPLALALSFSDFLRHPELGAPRLVAFLNQWAAARNRFAASLLLRHEDVAAAPAEQLVRLARFLDLPVNADAAREAAGLPDTTTRGLDDGSVRYAAADREYLAQQLARLDPALGYAPGVDGPGGEVTR